MTDSTLKNMINEGAEKERKAQAMIDILKDNKIVCDSVMKCEGWKENEYLKHVANRIDVQFKFCPWCGKEIKP